LLVGQLPIQDGIIAVAAYLDTVKNYVMEQLPSSEYLHEWVDLEDEEEWDMCLDANEEVRKNRRTPRKTKNQIMRDGLEREKKLYEEAKKSREPKTDMKKGNSEVTGTKVEKSKQNAGLPSTTKQPKVDDDDEDETVVSTFIGQRKAVADLSPIL